MRGVLGDGTPGTLNIYSGAPEAREAWVVLLYVSLLPLKTFGWGQETSGSNVLVVIQPRLLNSLIGYLFYNKISFPNCRTADWKQSGHEPQIDLILEMLLGYF